MERENRVSQSVLPADEQTFIRHLRSTKGPAFKNRQRLRLFIPASNDYSTADPSRLSQRKYFIPCRRARSALSESLLPQWQKPDT